MAQNDLMTRLGLLLGGRSSATIPGSQADANQSASDIMNSPAMERHLGGASRYNNPDRSGSMPDRYTGGAATQDWPNSHGAVPGRVISHERSSSTPEKNTYPSSEDMYTTVSSIEMSGEGTPDRGLSDASPISTLTG